MPETSDIDRYKRNHADECARKEIVAVVRAAAYFAREEASGYIEVTLYKEENPMGGLASALDALRAKLLKARGE